MKTWFEAKVRYEKTQANGMQKKVTESYLVDALSWTEAEARTIQEIKQITDEFTIIDIKPAKLSELFFSDDGDRYFKAKIQHITLDEKSGTEKKINTNILAQANDIDQAQEVIKENMKTTMSDYIIAEIKETKIIDIFTYNPINNETDHN